MITKHIKQFIEEHIETIEKQDWLNVFFAWYLHWGRSAGFTPAEDEHNIKELFSVLEKAFPNIVIDSHDARMEIIQTRFCDYIHAMERSPGTTVSWGGASEFLNSHLGFQEEAKSIFRSAAKDCGYIIKGPILKFEV